MPAGGNFTSCNCGPDMTACENPTQPVATVGLCLADGSPIAVTVVRDCAGTATSGGWLNLTTGAWSVGAPPAGTIACGDSRSITTNGTFCDVGPDGEVLGLVLVEYQYAADGSIAAVRLVDAVTGTTYTPTGEVTTCPAGTEQPERDLVQLCDLAADGTATAFLRDFARSETGAITGHSDYDLSGEPYTPAGTVALCPPESPCRSCQTLALCDVPTDTTPAPVLVPASQAGARTGTTATGVGFSTSSGTSTVAHWFPISLFPVATAGPFVLTANRPAAASWSARVGISGATTGRIVMPAGTELLELSPSHVYDTATRTLSPAAGAGQATANGDSKFQHPGPVTSLSFASDGTGGALGPTQRQVGDFALAPSTVPFLRTVCRDCDGGGVTATDTLLDGTTSYTVRGRAEVCQPEEAEPCASTVATLRLCDLDPNVEPDADGERCAVPFLRHLVHDCTGALVGTRDTTTDGTTPYAPVQVVDCGSGGVPAMVEVPWEVVGIAPDPGSVAGRGFLFSLSPIDDPDTVGVVKVTTTSTANTACAGTPPNYAFANPTTYTFQPDQVLQDAATYVRCDLIDFDTFEPITGLTPPPSRLGGTAYWDGSTVRPTESNGTGAMYYDGPPATWSYRVGNTGGGLSCSALSFAAVSLRPEGCCAPCGSSGGDGTGRTVQEVCVIANAAPADVMTWTRVIEDGGVTIYYLDAEGARYDDTLPAGHQIVACPTDEPEPCRATQTVLLCDTEEDPAEPAPTEGEPTVTDLAPPAPLPSAHVALAGGGASLWAGGSLVFPPDTTGGQVYRTVAARLTAPRPACDDGTATVTASVHVHLDGPTGTGGYGGALRLHDGAGVIVAEQGPPSSVPVGYDAVLTVTGQVPAADLAAGTVTVWLALETYQAGGKGWTTDAFEASHVFNAPAEPCQEAVQFLRTLVTDCATGEVVSVSDTTLDGAPYTVAGQVGQCVTVGGGQEPQEPCRDSSSTLLCDTSAADIITVFDPANRPDDDGWEVVSFIGEKPGAGPEAPMPYPARYGVPYGYPALGARADQYGGYGGGSWQGYDTAPVRWVLRKVFTAPEDGVAVAQSVGFRGDGGARVRINGLDAGMYGQWNQPATSGTAEIPVTAGANVVEIEVRDVNGINNVVGRLDIALPRTVQFMRRQTVDCETGAVISTTDTTLDGQPYTVTGEVGQCTPTSECCEQPPPELRVDIESDVMCIREADGEITGQVVVERVYDDQSGDRTEQRLTDPTTGDEVELPDGAELVLCQEPPCPTAFSTECVGAVTRTEAAYDNTSLIGGVPGQCGSVQGPNGQFPCQPTTGGLTITSWIVNGQETIGEGGGRTFAGGPCGEGAPGNFGMHHNWALALTNLDPSGATWSAQSAPGCAWFVGSTGGTQTVYGPMTVVDAGGQQWILGPAQACDEVQFTKVYSQECDGSVSVSWLDAQGVPTDAPEGDLVPCGTGCGTGGAAGLDIELVELCDVQADGTSVPFLRHITYGGAGQVSVVVDTALDAFAPYSPTGTVSVCQPEGQDVELLAMCVLDNATGNPLQEIVAEVRYDARGERTGVSYVDPETWGPVALPGGSHIGVCPDVEPTPAPDVELLALCDVAPDGVSTPFLRHLVYLTGATAPTVLDTALDGATPYGVTGEVGTCAPSEEEECRQTSTVELCDLAVTETVTVLDPTSVLGPDGWQVTSFTGAQPGYGPDGTIPYDAHHRINGAGVGQLSSRADFSMGPPTVPWPGYEAAPMAWVISKTFNLTVGGIARVQVDGFKGDHGARVRLNGQDLGLYAQYNQPVDGGVLEAPVTAGANVVEIEDHDINNVSYIQGRITVTVSGSTRFLRHYLLDCATGEVQSFTDTTLDGTPYTVAGEVGQCTLPVEDQDDGAPSTPCLATSVIEKCRYDDTDGDGVADVTYVELIGVGCDGAVTPLGAYTEGLAEPYTPVSPVDSEETGPDPVTLVEPHRVELGAGESWDASSVTLLQSVTATAHGGTGQITTGGGTSTLFEGESVSWSVIRDTDAALTGPLTIAAGPGVVTISYTRTTAS